MDLNKDNLRKIKSLILFTIVVLVVLWKYSLVLGVIGFVMGILFPFLLGGAIAFILNVPMHFIEEKLFHSKKSGSDTKTPADTKTQMNTKTPPYTKAQMNIKIPADTTAQADTAWEDRKSRTNTKAMKTNCRRAGGFCDKTARPLSLVFTILFVVGIISIVIFVVVPKLGSTVMSLGSSIQEFVPRVQCEAGKLFDNNKEIASFIYGIEINWNKLLNSMAAFFTKGAGSVIGSTFTVAKSIVSGMTTFVIAFVFACYILLQKERLNIQVRKVMYAYVKPGFVKKVLDVCSLTYKTFSSFLTGQCVEAVILGTMFVIAMTILRIPYALLVGVLIAFTALIPIFGAFIGCFVGAFIILMEAPVKALIFVIMFLVLQQIEGNLIYPKVVGSSVGLPSIWVLAAVSVGGSLLGIVGMLVFIPIVSVLYALFRTNVYGRLEKRGLSVDNETGNLRVLKEEASSGHKQGSFMKK